LIDERRLRLYASRYPEPRARFHRESTRVEMDMDEALAVRGTAENFDEHVHLHLEGTRDFAGVRFDIEALTITGLRDEAARKYFVAIARALLASFEQACRCGGLIDCYCCPRCEGQIPAREECSACNRTGLLP